MPSSKHILVLGSTGASGLAFCTTALAASHTLTLYVRNPSKLPTILSSNPRISVLEGTLEDHAGLARAASSGATVLVSFLGPAPGATLAGSPVTTCMRTLFPLLIANHFEHALILATPSFEAPQDKGALKWTILVGMVKSFFPDAYKEFTNLGAFVCEQDLAKLKWTVFRVPILGDGEAKEGGVKAGWKGTPEGGVFLSRKGLAKWLVGEVEKGVQSEWIGLAPILCE